MLRFCLFLSLNRERCFRIFFRGISRIITGQYISIPRIYDDDCIDTQVASSGSVVLKNIAADANLQG